MCLRNIASVGKFSSDRTILEYTKDIWHVPTNVTPTHPNQPLDSAPHKDVSKETHKEVSKEAHKDHSRVVKEMHKGGVTKGSAVADAVLT